MWQDAMQGNALGEDAIGSCLIQDEPVLKIHVQPGESHLVTRPAILRTLLGSCVGIAFWVPRLGIGALCHPMLPTLPPHPRGAMDLAASRRYVDFAVRDIAQQLDARGAHRGEVRVKLFGGADVLLMARLDDARPTVGKQNSEAAIKVLHEEGFDVAACKLGGTSGFNIHFYTVTGEVYMRRLD
jgi:chemotaxis protein CheD